MAQPKRKNSIAAANLGPNKVGTQRADIPLTEQQRRFVTFLVHDKLPQTAAARMAGYGDSPGAAYTLMKNPKIQRAIADHHAGRPGVRKSALAGALFSGIRVDIQ